MNLHMTQEWLLKMAEKEGNGVVSVGGLVGRVEANALALASPATERGALAQLVEWQRRKLRWSVEDLAEKANVEVEDVLAIETGEGTPEPRTLFNLAAAINLPPQKLMHLAGLVASRDPRLEKAAVRFAARSAPIEALTADQAAALEEFVRVIAE
jgi:transcriptional regulator with XRE-family HTH domain